MSSVITVGELLERAELEVTAVAGQTGFDRIVTVPRIQKPRLALTGWPEQLHPRRVLVLGGTEIEYLSRVDGAARALAIATVLASKPACVIVARDLEAPAELAQACEASRVPLIGSRLATADLIGGVTNWLQDQMSPSTSIHGVLLDVLGIGILLLGKSGIGKSEAALDLIMKGHRLVADDLVEVRRTSGDVLVGWASELIKHHMEVRGLGIINIKDMFGVAAVRDEKRIELVLELIRWDQTDAHDRLGLDEMVYPILEVQVPLLRIPVSPGRNVSSLIEVAARNRLLQVRGHHSAREFQERLDRALADARERRWRDDVE